MTKLHVKKWDTEPLLGKLDYSLRLHDTPIEQLAVHPNGSTFCTSSSDVQLYLFETEKGIKVGENKAIKQEYGGNPYMLLYVADGERIVTASGTRLWPGIPPGTIIVFSAKDLGMLGIQLGYSLDRIVQHISPDGKLALVSHFGDNWHTFMDLGMNKTEVWDISIADGQDHDCCCSCSRCTTKRKEEEF
jgi:WD40 repeat protein